MGLSSRLGGQSIIFNVQVPSVAGSSGNSSFYGYYNDQLNKNNWNLLNMPSVLIILATTVYTRNISHLIYTNTATI